MTRPNEHLIPWDRLFAAAGRADVDAALRDLFQAIDRDIAERTPTCWLSGKCCRFDTYGHRLYVTALEAAWLVRQVTAEHRVALMTNNPTDLDGCVFQRGKLCGVHGVRPLGCRIFFCDPSATWQNVVYETYLNALREMHTRFDLPYFYLEWRTALAEAREAVS